MRREKRIPRPDPCEIDIAEITAKIKFSEWVDGHSLRQPSIQGFVDVPAHQCVLETNL
ncbi:hypothetical protein [Brevibacillus laterosporus]|uniref:hypothetical protein n=1 Tax=Brevibacillus laterosporus TaxID=1465 RepID=UPI0021581D17|nr:hypothetical protein [Brevibacillus laterosporus]